MIVYETFLVHIPTERPFRAAMDAAVSLALSWGAHVDAVAAGFEELYSAFPVVMDASAAVATIHEADREHAIERARAALTAFKIEARNAGLSYECCVIAGTFAEVVSTLGPMARVHDLTIVSQPEPKHDTFDNQVPQQLLFQSGGPVLYIPYIFRGTFNARRIGICWDGSRLAARALRDAMPFILRADALTVISINGNGTAPAEASQDQLVRYLARRGLPTRAISLDIDRADIQSAILSIAADESLDLLVMGGYGHSRLQELILGGVTRDMFRSMTVPTLMSH
jgi:nucleotide-binding universal stress UspA family protein